MFVKYNRVGIVTRRGLNTSFPSYLLHLPGRGRSACRSGPTFSQPASLKIIALVFLVVLPVLLSACNLKPDRDEEDEKKQPPAKTSLAPDGSIHLTQKQIQAIGLQTARVVEQTIAATIDSIGIVTPKPGSEAQVFSPFAGRLIVDPNRAPRIGSVVKKGELIAEVEQLLNVTEKTQFRANIAQLEANIVQAEQETTFRKTEVDRTRQLYEGGATALKQLQTAEFNLKQAQAQLDGARHAKTVYEAAENQQSSGPLRISITAPVSGTVVAADLTSGQMTDPGKNLLTIVNLSTVWVRAPVHESDIPMVRKAISGEIVTPANPNRTYTGKVVTIGNVVDRLNRTTEVIFALENRDLSLKIGMTADVRIAAGPSGAKGVSVPASAVLLAEGQSAIYVETEPGTYIKRLVTIGPRFGNQIVVMAGLSPGESVVTVGAQALLGEASKNQIPTAED
ncbi:MAG TPA: efflux RND transporter periplasmic adaptor subunit [Blastocatellia bacterium]|nr:efflux RND transporter periplasmic adaptor subunit [Blastocatellia bacterium]